MDVSVSHRPTSGYFRDFLSKVSSTFLTRILVMAVALVVSVLVARILGPASQGLYASAVALGAVCVQFVNMGLSTSNTYLVAKSSQRLFRLFGNSLLLSFVCGFFAVMTLWLVRVVAPSWISLDGVLLFLVSLWVFPGLLLQYSQSLFLGLQEVGEYNKVEIFHRLIHALLLIFAVFLGFKNVQSFFFVFLVAYLVIVSYASIRLIRLSDYRFPVPSRNILRQTWLYGMSAYLAGLFSYLCLRFDLLMLNSMAGAESAGYYSIAVSLADVVYTFPVVVGTILFSKLSAQNNFKEKKKFATRVLLLLAGLMLAGVSFAYILVEPLLPRLYGVAYAPSIEPFRLLLPGILCLSLSTIVQNFIASSGRSWLMFIGPALAFSVNFVLNLLWIPEYGETGAALASTVSYGAWFLVAIFIFLGIKPKKERVLDLDMNEKDYGMSVYAMSEGNLKHLNEEAGSYLDVIEISQVVREHGVVKLWFHLQKMKIRNLYFLNMDSGQSSLREIICAFSLFANAHRLHIVGPNETQVLSRSQMFKALIDVCKASVQGFLCVLSTRRQLKKLVRQPRVSVKEGRRSLLFLKANLWFGVKAGGSIGHVAGVVNGFLSRGYRVTCAAISKPLLIKRNASYKNLPFDRTFAYPVEINNYLYNEEINKELSQGSKNNELFGCIYQRLSLGNFSGVFLSRLWKKPLVIEYNGSEVWVSSNWGKKLKFHNLADLCERVCLQHAHLIVTVSNVLRDELVEKGVEKERIVTYPNCVDPEFFSPERFNFETKVSVRERHDLKEDQLLVTFVGTFGKWHGVNVLADTIAKQFKENQALLDDHKVRFLLVGDGSEMPAVRKTIYEAGCEDYVRFTGLVEQHLAPEYLYASDILVSPHVPNADGSRFFGSPTKLFEYMAMEKPIVASRLEQLAEVFDGSVFIDEDFSKSDFLTSSALLCQPSEIASFDRSLRYLYENQDVFQNLGVNARKQVLRKYTWDIHVEEILEGLGRVLS